MQSIVQKRGFFQPYKRSKCQTCFEQVKTKAFIGRKQTIEIDFIGLSNFEQVKTKENLNNRGRFSLAPKRSKK